MKGYYQCECGKEFTNPQSFNGHKSHCKIHLEKTEKLEQRLQQRKEQCNKANDVLRKNWDTKKQQALQKWISEQHTCEKCGKVMTEKFGSGRFCSRSCANSREHSEETKQKIKYSITKYIDVHGTANIKSKCQICGIPINSNRKSNLCKACKNEIDNVGKYKEDYVVCPYCNLKFKLLNLTHLRTHGVTIEKLHEDFGHDYPVCSKSYAIHNHSNYVHGKLYPITHKNKTIYLKSCWEKEIFLKLELLQIDFSYETLSISYSYDNKIHYYIPDFYIPICNLVIEVKPEFARLTSRNTSKKEACIKQGYNFEYVTGDSNIKLIIEKYISTNT